MHHCKAERQNRLCASQLKMAATVLRNRNNSHKVQNFADKCLISNVCFPYYEVHSHIACLQCNGCTDLIHTGIKCISYRPGFGWARVDVHKKPGGDTAGPADPNRPDKWDIQYHVPSCSVLSRAAGWGRG